MKNNLFGYTLEKLQNELVLSEFKKFNATQIYEWIFQKRQLDFQLMTNLSNPLKNHLEETFSLDLLPVITKQTSFDGTTKFLFKLVDGYSIDSTYDS